MVDIEDAVRFYNSYLDADYAGAMAANSEPDEILDAREAEVMSFMHVPRGIIMSPGFGRRRGCSASEIARRAQWADCLRRSLFLVVEFAYSDGHGLFGGYAGGGRSLAAGSYSELIFAREIDGELKIVAFHMKDFDIEPPPVHWVHHQGTVIDDPGEPVRIRPLLAPTLETNRRDWEMWRGMFPK